MERQRIEEEIKSNVLIRMRAEENDRQLGCNQWTLISAICWIAGTAAIAYGIMYIYRILFFTYYGL